MKKKMLAASLGLGLVCSAVIGSSAIAGPPAGEDEREIVVVSDGERGPEVEPNGRVVVTAATMVAAGALGAFGADLYYGAKDYYMANSDKWKAGGQRNRDNGITQNLGLGACRGYEPLNDHVYDQFKVVFDQ